MKPIKNSLKVCFLLIISVQIHGMYIIDCNGKKDKITQGEAKILLGGTLQGHEDFPGQIDFTGVTRSFLNKKNLKKLLQYCKYPEDFWEQRRKAKQFFPQEADLLLAGDYLGVDKNLLFNFANRVWPHLQDWNQISCKKLMQKNNYCV